MQIGGYEIQHEIGRGGMGAVFRGRAANGRDVAVKLLVKADEASFARFERERRLLASLGPEEGFVGLLDAGRSAEGHWLVMPFVPGGTLRQRLDGGPLGIEDTRALGIALARALGHAHERGVVHRDVKPENVIFSASGRPLLADLGLAKHFDRGAPGASQSVSLSHQGSFRGTAGYTAPEQIDDASSVGPRADVFALGAVLYECLAGRPAFHGESLVAVFARLTSGTVEPIDRPGVPASLERIVRRALAPDPRARFGDGNAFAEALDARSEPTSRQPVVPILVGAALGGALLVGFAVAYTRPPSVTPPPASPTVPEPRVAPAPAVPASTPLSARELVKRAEDASAREDWDAAVALSAQAIALDPNYGRAWANHGWARGNKGDLAGEISDETRALELDPALERAWVNRAAARGTLDDLDGAIEDLTRAIEIDPALATAWANRAGIWGKKGDWDRALADATRAVELDPALAMAWLNRAAARSAKGDAQGTIVDTTRAIELEPRLTQAWMGRGLARLSTNDLPGAIVDLERAIELDPDGVNTPRLRQVVADARQRVRSEGK